MTKTEALQAIHSATGGDLFDANWEGGSWMVAAVETADTLSDHEAASSNWAKCGEITRGTIAGLPFVCFGEVQARAGDVRRELSVIDLGDVRVAVAADLSDWDE